MALSSTSRYDAEDELLDLVYKETEDQLKSHSRNSKEEKKLDNKSNQIEEVSQGRTIPYQQLSGGKRCLTEVSVQEWNSIPEVGDDRYKKHRQKQCTPPSDSVLTRNLTDQPSTSSGTRNSLVPSLSGSSKPAESLDLHASANQSLQSTTPNYSGKVSDIKRTRQLLKSDREANPTHPPAWIACAHLEETVGRLQAARNLILNGCEHCPESKELWLEAVRLSPNTTKGTRSVKLWMKEAGLERDLVAKRRVYRKALQDIPKSVALWKAAIELEEPDDARILLSAAVKCCPTSVELWLVLAGHETYENARKVLEEAREKNPSDIQLWIAAAKLEEAHGNEAMVTLIIQRSIVSLAGSDIKINNREHWLKEAVCAEKDGAPLTCKAIFKFTMNRGIESRDRKRVWLAVAESFTSQGAYECARAVYGYITETLPEKKSIWMRAAHFEHLHGTQASLKNLLQKAIVHCPQATELWLMAVKSKWVADDVPIARSILSHASQANSNSEEIWLAAVKLEIDNREYERARELLAKARSSALTPRMLMKSAKLEWQLGNLDEALAQLRSAIEQFPDYAKFYMMKGQIYALQTNITQARESFNLGTETCPTSIPLWLLLSRLDESQGRMTRARSVLEKARNQNPQNPQLWLEAIRLEWGAGLKDIASAMLAKALQECPNSGLLLAETVFMADSPQRKTKSFDAMIKCEYDPHVLLSISKLFWAEKNMQKCRDWFNRTVIGNPDFGDAWTYYYKFELLHGTPAEQEEVKKRCTQAEPHHGELWTTFAKKPENWTAEFGDILVSVATALPVPI